MQNRKSIFRFCLLLLCSFFYVSCSSTQGELSATILSDHRARVVADSPDNQSKGNDEFSKETDSGTIEQSDNVNPPGIEVTSAPAGAKLYVNGEYHDRTPVFIPDPGTGVYTLVLRKDGYYEKSYRIEYTSGTILILDYELRQITGFLSISTTPKDSEILLDGQVWPSGIRELPIGRYTITVRKFSYDQFTQTISVLPERTTSVSVILRESDFSLTNLTLSRSVFSPQNPGKLGTTTIGFRVSSFGHGMLRIFNDEDDIVYRHRFPYFQDWKQQFQWDGTDTKGEILPDGKYRIRVTGSGAQQDNVHVLEKYVTIDRNANLSYRPLLNGISGLVYAGLPDVLPPLSFQLSTIVIGHYDSTTFDTRIPVQISARIGIFHRLEFDLQGSLFISSNKDSRYPFSVGGALKYRLTPNDSEHFQAAVALKGNYYDGDQYDTFSNFAAGTFSIPLQIGFGPFSLALTPELSISHRPVDYYSDVSEANVFVWGYGKVGVMLDFGIVWTGISASLRTRPFHEGFRLDLPFQAGAEMHFLIPKTEIIVSAFLCGEFDPSRQSWYLLGGGGLGFLH